MTNQNDNLPGAPDQAEEAAKDVDAGLDSPASQPEQASRDDGRVEAKEPEIYALQLLAVVGGEVTFNFLWQQLAGNAGLATLLNLAEVGLDKAELDVWLARTLDGCRKLMHWGVEYSTHITRAELSVLTTKLKLMTGVQLIELLADAAHGEPADGWDALRYMAEGLMLTEETERVSEQWQDVLRQETAEWRKTFLRGLDEAYTSSTGKDTREQLWPIIDACVQISSWRVR